MVAQVVDVEEKVAVPVEHNRLALADNADPAAQWDQILIECYRMPSNSMPTARAS